MNGKNYLKTEILKLRLEGFSYRGIAKKLNIGRMTAWRYTNGKRGSNADGRTYMAKIRKSQIRPFDDKNKPKKEDFDSTEDYINQLELENTVLREAIDFLKVESLSTMTNKDKTILIQKLGRKTQYKQSILIRYFNIKKNTYFYHKQQLDKKNIREIIKPTVIKIFKEKGNCSRGYRFVHHNLVNELECTVSEKIVRDVMKNNKLEVLYKKKQKKYTSYKGEIDNAPDNLLINKDYSHDFHADKPNEKWVSDITEFKLPTNEKIYLSPIIDLYDSMPVSWSIGTSPNAKLVNDSLQAACSTLNETEQPIIHTDRGSHYRWPEWKQICKKYFLTRSMSRKGNTGDNAAAEGFFGRLKNEFFYGRDWKNTTVQEFIDKLNLWMEYYKNERLKLFESNEKKFYCTIIEHRIKKGYAA